MKVTKHRVMGRPKKDPELRKEKQILFKLEQPVYDSFVSLCEKNQLGMNTLLRSLVIDQLIKESSQTPGAAL